ncbi:MAG TPA: hypothetical protein VGY55_05805 [Pirellulales bacterium]|jgi:hypothetical protein|nr:hypothetical protein [Pirellulales bacterium]
MAHPDMDELLNEALDAAEQFLEKIGEFFPFVVTMSPEGEISHAQEYLGEEPPAAEETVDVLIDGLKQAAAKGTYKATALVSDAHLPSPDGKFQDAVSVLLEHQSEPPVTCYLPYKHVKGKFEFGEVFAKRADRRVFAKAAEKASPKEPKRTEKKTK